MSKFIKLYEQVRSLLGEADLEQNTSIGEQPTGEVPENPIGQDTPPEGTSDESGIPDVNENDYKEKLDNHINNVSQMINNFKEFVTNPNNTLDSIRDNENFKSLDAAINKDNLDKNLDSLNSLFVSNPTETQGS